MINLNYNELPVDEAGEKLYMVDVGRPDIVPENIDMWRTFHEWVESAPIEIAVSSVYGAMSAYIAEEQYYLGGGFKYCFWFFSDEDKQEFIKECTNIFNDKWKMPDE